MSWEGGENGSRGSGHPNYNYHQNYFGDNNQTFYVPNSYQYQGAQWCNPPGPAVVMPQEFPRQEYIPSYVCHNTRIYNNDVNGEMSSQSVGGAIPKQNYNQRRPNTGANRLYRNIHVNQNPHAYRGNRMPTAAVSDKQIPSQVPSVGETSKSEDKKKLLAEVATLLNQDKKEPKNGAGRRHHQQNWQRSNQKSWAAVQNQQQQGYQMKQEKREIRKQDNRKEPEGQRERLVDQLTRGKLECLVCCERLRQNDFIWSCQKCYHVLHLECTSKWARASTLKTETGVRSTHDISWRCPACQHVYDVLPSRYTCFCGKMNNPKWIKGETPHCCGDMCGKRKGCNHPCTLLCHPGPCPPCSATVLRECGCGRSQQQVKCSSTLILQCELLCGKMLDCGRHDCLDTCHQGPCKPCNQKQTQKCYCGKEQREVGCGGAYYYSCDSPCGKGLDCGLHKCEKACHSGACPPCPADLSTVTTCHCGARPAPRSSCIEPVPSCGAPCPLVKPTCDHPCKEVCHPPPCPKCDVMVLTPCLCGHNPRMEATCHDVTHGNLPLCKKKCVKKRSCGKHKCNQECCIDSSHKCTLPCNKTLSCGQHKCPTSCHRGNCNPCPIMSFEELSCECGRTIVYPPVECGTRLPECRGPCLREHSCEHPPTHNCHTLPTCPPCTVLVSRQCYGGHEIRKAVPCYIAEYSCGIPCDKPLPCEHRCQERCHGGDCPTECNQPCPLPRPSCGHPCNLPCHKGRPCGPKSPCQAKLKVFCQCGRRSQPTTCSEYSRSWGRILATEQAATSNSTVIIDPTKINLKVLECDSDCKLYERNLKLAIGLQIANPDLSNKLKPQYSETMRSWAKKDPRFCDMVYKQLTNLVTLAKESKQKSRSYSFDIMSAQKRQFIHEYCKHFGCESVAYDAEPKRNVVATAYKDKCWLPSYSLLEVIQRENGQRKVPLPSLKKEPMSDPGSSKESREMVQLSVSKPPLPRAPSPPEIDYFDFTPTS